jgi:hypothetical protein
MCVWYVVCVYVYVVWCVCVCGMWCVCVCVWSGVMCVCALWYGVCACGVWGHGMYMHLSQCKSEDSFVELANGLQGLNSL